MYLVNPRTTPAMLEDSPFGLFESRVHCGFEHGTSVWLKYLPPLPVFTHDIWDRTVTYIVDEPVYSPISGECYKSLINGNIGHDPAQAEQQNRAFQLEVEVTQRFHPEVPPEPATSEVWRIQVDDPDHTAEANVRYLTGIVSEDGNQGNIVYVTPGVGGTVQDVLDGIEAAFAASINPFVMSLVFAQELPNLYTLTLSTARFSCRGQVDPPGSGNTVDLPLEHLSNYSPGRAGQDAVPQLTVITLHAQFEFQSTLYSFVARDSANQQHQVGYLSAKGEAFQTTFVGIRQAILDAAAGDPWWGTVVVVGNLDTNSGTFTTIEDVRFQGTAEIKIDAESVAAWEKQVFPLAIAEPVMRGVYSDALREEGQTDKAGVEEQAAAPELAIASGKSVFQPGDRLTNQQVSKSRYRM
jgi:hypothetical protein